MLAMVFTAPGVVEMQEVPEPEPRPGESLVHICTCGICGSDLHGFRSGRVYRPPLVMGHEFAGVVDNGDRVVVNPLLTCGKCNYCERGRPELCREGRVLGVNLGGGLTERIAVSREHLRRLPDSIDWFGAAMIEPLANAVHAWRQLPERPERVAVVGAGAIGLAVSLVAMANGVTPEVIDRAADRLKVAGSLGATACDALTGEYDVIIDAVGLSVTRRKSLEHLRPGGSAIWIGLAEPEVSINGNQAVVRQFLVRGSFAYTPKDFDQAVELAQDTDLSWVTPFPLNEAVPVFMSLANGRTDIAKAVITTQHF